MKNIIIISKGSIKEPWGSLKKICKAYQWKYNTVIKKKFPFYYKGYLFERKPFNTIIQEQEDINIIKEIINNQS